MSDPEKALVSRARAPLIGPCRPFGEKAPSHKG